MGVLLKIIRQLTNFGITGSAIDLKILQLKRMYSTVSDYEFTIFYCGKKVLNFELSRRDTVHMYKSVNTLKDSINLMVIL